ncbi:glycogen synthase [Glaciecola sp. SC05]|uniref:glycogen synthase n=1 Tax=Glaciecola sp. SC05 TaxID=1987355 RepID=UPI003528F914
MNILFLISEVEDIIKTGGLADVGKALPLALAERGHKIKIVLPYYKQVAADFALADAMPKQSIHIHQQHYEFGVKQLSLHDLDVYLVDHPYFSENATPYSEDASSNAQRFAFFSLAALKIASELNFQPDLVHTHDWHTAIANYFVKSDFIARHAVIADDQFFAKSKTVITIHNAAFQGVCALSRVPILDDFSHSQVNTDNGYLNLLKTGISYADKVCPVSPTYAQEIKSMVGSHGIFDVINQAPYKVTGVLNGCDYTQWDPSNDPLIPHNFSLSNMTGKEKCKVALQKKSKLKALKTVPLFGMVCRATQQKGFAYLMPMLAELFEHKVQLVIMGTGDVSITAELKELAKQYPEQFAFIEAFSPEWAHLIEAGSDFFLMPSEFEPCGLNQMYSLAYGTLPVVRSVGGLADTVIDASDAEGNGFVFLDPSSEALLSCLRRVLLLTKEQPKLLQQMQTRAMQKRFTWQQAAKEYEQVYTS